MNAPSNKKGRPPSAKSLASAAVNYEALAWQVKRRIENAAQEGQKLKIIDAVKAEMLTSVDWRNENGLPTRKGLVDSKLLTAYTEVRKILSNWKNAEKK